MNWLELIFGALLGGFVSISPSLFFAIKGRISPSPYSGEFWSYNYSTVRDGSVNVDRWKIKTNWAGKLVINSNNASGKSLEYLGDVYILNGKMHIVLKGKKHDEVVHFIYSAPIEAEIRLLKGIYSGISMTGKPIAGTCLISNKELNDPDIVYHLGKPNFLSI